MSYLSGFITNLIRNPFSKTSHPTQDSDQNQQNQLDGLNATEDDINFDDDDNGYQSNASVSSSSVDLDKRAKRKLRRKIERLKFEVESKRRDDVNTLLEIVEHERTKADEREDGEGEGEGEGEGKAPLATPTDYKEIARSLHLISGDVAQVDLPSAKIHACWGLRSTAHREKRINCMKREYANAADGNDDDDDNGNGNDNDSNNLKLPNTDGPLDFMYKKVFSVMLMFDDDRSTPAGGDGGNLEIFFYDEWAEQMSKLGIERGDEIQLKVPGCSIFNNETREYVEVSGERSEP